MSSSLTSQFTFSSKSLNLFCTSLHDQVIPDWVNDEVSRAFEALSPFIKNREQVLYIRDIPFLAIDGKYPGGHCYNEYEAMIALTSWKDNKQQIIATINHELHHMARWQNPGYGDTLGGAIVSEGIATYYEELVSGWTSPWSQAKVNSGALQAAKSAWDDKNYNHGEWFFDGPHGKWTGYGLGYQLALKLFADNFDLAKSITIEPHQVRSLLNKF